VQVPLQELYHCVSLRFTHTRSSNYISVSASNVLGDSWTYICLTGHLIGHLLIKRRVNLWSHVQCTPINDVTLRCPSPQVSIHGRSGATKRSLSTTGGSVTSSSSSSSSSTSHEYTIGFTMDDVESVGDLPLFFPDVRSTFTVHADPSYDQFRNGKKVYKGEALILTVNITICIIII